MNDMSATATRLLLFGWWRENPGRTPPAEVIEISPDLSRLSRDRSPGRSAATLQPSIALSISHSHSALDTESSDKQEPVRRKTHAHTLSQAEQPPPPSE